MKKAQHKVDPLTYWMELFFVWLLDPANHDAGWRRYTPDAMMIDYHTRLTGEPIEHDLKQINEALRLNPDSPHTQRIKAALDDLTRHERQSIVVRYFYIGQKPDVLQGGKYETADWAQILGVSEEVFRKRLSRARTAVMDHLGIKQKTKSKAA